MTDDNDPEEQRDTEPPTPFQGPSGAVLTAMILHMKTALGDRAPSLPVVAQAMPTLTVAQLLLVMSGEATIGNNNIGGLFLVFPIDDPDVSTTVSVKSD